MSFTDTRRNACQTQAVRALARHAKRHNPACHGMSMERIEGIISRSMDRRGYVTAPEFYSDISGKNTVYFTSTKTIGIWHPQWGRYVNA